MGIIFGSHFGKTGLRSNVIKTECGKVVGKRYCIGEGKFADAFLGIPFAKPPVGELRFQYPEAPDPWDGVRMCLKHGDRCTQKGIYFEIFQPRVSTSEDCLYLNVFAPAWDLPADQPNGRAVMVFIHGGAFVMHSSANYGDENICRNLCAKEVIVVTIQYRLGILGFVATGDKNAIPNLGLWDQTLALKWVKDNIKHFGGDPENITLFGQSAGGASADMLCISPKSNQYFNKVIPMAGSASCSWSFKSPDDIRQTVIDHALKCGWKAPSNVSDDEFNKSLMDFLRGLPSKKLAVGVKLAVENDTLSVMNYAPVMDGNFFPESVAELRKKAPKMLCMTGTCEYEALCFIGLARKELGIKNHSKVIQMLIPDSKYDNAESLRKELEGLLLKDGTTKDEILKLYVKLLSDGFMNDGIKAFALDMTTAGHTVYLYSFEHFNPKCFGFLRFLFPFQAATHASELAYVFGKSPDAQFTMTKQDESVKENMTTLFTNFAKYGDPNGTGEKKLWQPVEVNDTLRYLCITTNGPVMKSDYEEGRGAFWKKVKNNLKTVP